MPISKKIIDQVKATTATDGQKALMMKILEIEDKGIFRYEAAYEKEIREFIDSNNEKEDDN